ncbi:hypothetical protein OIO90_006428 [Microbotryomycetes sp. JL221]|nr:hypothetical protein OIO90_006428 [Microbotryomycetes sp. JL221]
MATTASATPASAGRFAGLKHQVDDLVMSSILKSASIGSGPGYNPFLILAVPPLALAATLLYTYHARAANHGADVARDGSNLSAAAPVEDSIDYLANLQNIQIMMGRVSDLSDFMRLFVPYLTWREERVSLVLLQLSAVASVVLVVVGPHLPWRLIALVGGEALFFAGHPISKAFLLEMLPRVQPQAQRLTEQASRLAEDDSLPDAELDGEIIDVERLELESRLDDQWVPELVVGGELPVGFEWLSTSDWQLDRSYASGRLDAATRASTAANAGPSDTDFVSRRVKRHLAELERTNYTEQAVAQSAFSQGTEESEDAPARGAATYHSEDPQGRKRKKTMAVRSLLLYRKTLTALQEENVGYDNDSNLWRVYRFSIPAAE